MESLSSLKAAVAAGDWDAAERAGEAIRRAAATGSLDRASAERVQRSLKRTIGELTDARGLLALELTRLSRGRRAVLAYRSDSS